MAYVWVLTIINRRARPPHRLRVEHLHVLLNYLLSRLDLEWLIKRAPCHISCRHSFSLISQTFSKLALEMAARLMWSFWTFMIPKDLRDALADLSWTRERSFRRWLSEDGRCSSWWDIHAELLVPFHQLISKLSYFWLLWSVSFVHDWSWSDLLAHYEATFILLLINRVYRVDILSSIKGLVTKSFNTFVLLVDSDPLLIEMLLLSFHSNICYFEALLCKPVIGQEILDLTFFFK